MSCFAFNILLGCSQRTHTDSPSPNPTPKETRESEPMKDANIQTRRISGILERIEVFDLDKSGNNPRYNINFFFRPNSITPSPQNPISATIFIEKEDGSRSSETKIVDGLIMLRLQSKKPLRELPEPLKSTLQAKHLFFTVINQYGKYKVGDSFVVDADESITLLKIVEHHPQD